MQKKIKKKKVIPEFIQVGKTKLWDKKNKKEFICKYSDVPADDLGWVTNLMYRPINGDLLYLRRKDKKDINGWWTGNKWSSLRLRQGDIITAWKRNLLDDRALY